jgi:energy-coupling factor transport system permease protein
MSLAYSNGNRPLDRLSTEIKLIWAIGLAVGILFCQSILGLAMLLAVLGVLGIMASGMMQAFRKFALIAIPAILIIMAIHLFYHSGEELFRIWILVGTLDGIKQGILNALRFLDFGFAAILTIGNIEPVELGRKIIWGFGLFKMRMMSELGLVFFIAVRFVPLFVEEISTIKLAMSARGADFSGSLIKRIRIYLRMMLPLFSRVIRQADDIACAISLKGYKGTYLVGKKPRLGFSEIAMVFLAVSVAVVLVIA